MERPGLRPGHLLATAGGISLLVSLWAPWCRIEIGGMVRATLDALKRSTTPAEIAAKRGKSVEDLFN